MYATLIPYHSLIRWLLSACLLYCLFKSVLGVTAKTAYSKFDNVIRSAASAISHIQLIIGLILYFKSPLVTYLRGNFSEGIRYTDMAFFGVFHISIMIIAVLLITIGAAKAKRASTDYLKHKHVLIWFGLAILLIIIAIPWPFSEYAARPYFRSF